MSDDTEIDVSGAELEIDGELHYVESGTLTIQRDGIWAPNGELVKVTTRQITIDVVVRTGDRRRLTHRV